MILGATEDLLGVLKYALLALLYLFFARVLWAVWSEVRQPKRSPFQHNTGTPAPLAKSMPRTVAPVDVTAGAPVPAGSSGRIKVRRGKGGIANKLVIVSPKEHKGAEFAVDRELTIGRNDTCIISLASDTFASGLHARVFRLDGHVRVEDMGSTNGTFVNGRRIAEITVLDRGDSLQVGQTVFEAD